MIIPVVWKTYHKETPATGYWDHALLHSLFEGYLWATPGQRKFSNYTDFDEIPEGSGAVVVIPARYHLEDIKQINADIAKLPWVIMIISGDEEANFPVEKLRHPHMIVYLMTPHAGKNYDNVDRFIGEGFPTQAHAILRHQEFSERPYGWSFAGQVTHERREQCIKELRQLPNGKLIETKGFTQGVSHHEYYPLMAASKVIPCPSGPETPDTFRLYEALEAGCVPIADAISTKNPTKGYWEMLFGEDIAFPILENWEEVGGHIQYHSDVYPRTNNKVFAWWQKQKRQMAYNLRDDVNFLIGSSLPAETLRDKITVLIPTSPIISHPDTSIIEETISTIRAKLPECEIIIMFDGVRAEQEDRRANYEAYKQKMIWKCNFEYSNVLPVVFEEHMHQAAMTRECLKLVQTPMILFVEHDTPITPDCDFEWEGLVQAIEFGDAYMIRFHFESHILDAQKHMMLDTHRQDLYGVKMMRTAQWSQRPHLASTDFYRRIIDANFTMESRTMIEDKMHSVVHQAWLTRRKAGWNDYKLWIYTPEGNIKRSYHTDGRGIDPKFEMKF